ncbi:type II toxin-antitoxin system YafQ family toxin [Rothia sp. SD9660Na]|nr:type II toxin-antitoxin system YafQ family toxin [Rothia sp. SD9660Na]WHS51509.1 type II toxin-antitoxin system YafQ family toxin [Rothia sp. SD9660Na]
MVNLLATEQELPPRDRDHAPTGNFSGMRGCHIAPDWLLIYEKDDGVLALLLIRTGSHSDLFKE